MKETEEIPEKLKCFVCLELITNYKLLIMNIKCKDSTVVAPVAICESDREWVISNPDAAVALLQSRLAAIVKADNEA